VAGTRAVEVSKTVAARPERVYALVANLARMGEWSPETRRVRWRRGESEARPGARFRGTNRHGIWRWRTTCTIQTADPGRELSWRSSLLGMRVASWRYVFEPVGPGATWVTESTEDQRGLLLRVLFPVATGVIDRAGRNATTMRLTLERIKIAAERAAA
jgi:uncharacterized protein YndB with AHSA1/START domain